MGRVALINISEKKGVPKHPIDKGFFRLDYGLEGDYHKADIQRQVSLFARESKEKVKTLDTQGFCTTKFVENITTEDIVLYELFVGTKLKIGEVTLEITQVGKECYVGCELQQITDECVMTREIIFAKVVAEGWIKTGDGIVVEG